MTSHPAAPPPMPAQPGEASPRRGRWLIALAVVWALVLVALAYVSVRRDPPSVREQRGLGAAARVVHGAIGQLLAAAGADVVADIGGDTLAEGCRITPMRSGGTLTHELVFYTTETDGPALLDRIAAALPGSYRATVRHSSDGRVHSLRADAGEFVGVRGGVGEPGAVTLTVSTGCRPVDDFTAADLLPARPIDEEPKRVLAALGATGIESGRTVGVSCAAGRAAFTAHVTGRVPTPRPFVDALRSMTAGATVVLDTPERLVYRTQGRGVVVERRDHHVAVSVTIPCPAG